MRKKNSHSLLKPCSRVDSFWPGISPIVNERHQETRRSSIASGFPRKPAVVLDSCIDQLRRPLDDSLPRCSCTAVRSHIAGIHIPEDVVRSFCMSNFDAVLAQLKQQRDALNDAIAALESLSTTGITSKRTLSTEARARIAAAQRARWAKAKGKKVVPITTGRKRKLSTNALANIRAAQRKRWATWRKQKKTA